MNSSNYAPGAIMLRSNLKAGDTGSIIHLHGVLYAQEYGFDRTFEAYVAEPLSQFVLRGSPRDRIWLAEREGQIVGCIAIVAASDRVAQLRWFLVDPSARGFGLGKRLLGEALGFSKACSYESVMLWTVGALEVARHLYMAAGFRKVEEKAGRHWGVEVIEEKYELSLAG